MLISMTDCLQKYNIQHKGILHIGIHEGQECDEYINLGFETIVCIDANYDYIEMLKLKYPTIRFIYSAISNYNGNIEFNITNNGQSSSILDLNKHSNIYPDIVYIDKTTVPCFTIDSFDFQTINVINLDIQGAELLALQGGAELLKNIDMIYTEINLDELYTGCCLKHELDGYLSNFGFVCKEQYLAHPTWGDAVYIKE